MELSEEELGLRYQVRSITPTIFTLFSYLLLGDLRVFATHV
jgi:hypothetical protein